MNSACAAFSPDGKTLALGAGNRLEQEKPSSIRLWDLSEGRDRGRIDGLRRPAESLVFSPDGKTIASVGGLVMVDLWDVATGARINTLQGAYLPALDAVFSLDGKALASGAQDGHVRLWDTATGRPIAEWPNAANPSFSPIGNVLAMSVSMGSHWAIRWHDLDSGKILATLPEQAGDFAFSPDGTLLASSSSCYNCNGEIHLWDVRRGIPTLPPKTDPSRQ
jgi:WD40 repeat protein